MKFRFDFADYRYCFEKPLYKIATNKLDEVISCLHQVEQAVAKGYYAAGFISYEAAPAFRSYLKTHPPSDFPLIWFGIFDQPVAATTFGKNIGSLSHPQWFENVSWEEYRQAIEKIQHHIAIGDTYQVNYTLRMYAQFKQDPYAFYLHLLKAQQANYSAYLDIGSYQILSASPELFFEFKEGTIITKPMKGTAPRGVTNDEDDANQRILHNEKNHAENLMITDLLRNDLGQIALQGSVNVPNLFTVEKYPTVWQLTSTVTASVSTTMTVTEILQALFPCGSVTGAPKAKTMDIICQLEKEPRNIYCGALGIITPNQQAIFSVPIRTMIIDKDQAVYGVGGGITWDSTSKDEYEEIIHKAQVLYQSKIPDQLLETLLLENGNYFLYDYHLDRLKESAHYFNFSYDFLSIKKVLAQLAQNHPHGSWKIRLLLTATGKVETQISEVFPILSSLRATWSPMGMHSRNTFLYHKTTQREFYPKVSMDQECLLFNERNEVTEFVNGNVILYKEGEWITPVCRSGLLNGTMRQYLLEQNKIKEAVIYKKDIQPGCKMAFINSVRKWRNVIWEV
ncbi:aminodeoxychorismate synthase component I [Commensalibacter oyaizuii]|uniref:Probable branched-chain-amino-acid aminotransferase n=1 Tax=Commensalibacter oyaizuii TaxID=3043873 RepID=A0ABT6Q2Z9_9PROT|nr:aminodeoxychorismate synthase component I [Commensalibacter sp. TBRC 16381]MDI2091504.1 aminodeoxychorismate synthase component I [Commensalibacter sp. TBRC 16381]